MILYLGRFFSISNLYLFNYFSCGVAVIAASSLKMYPNVFDLINTLRICVSIIIKNSCMMIHLTDLISSIVCMNWQQQHPLLVLQRACINTDPPGARGNREGEVQEQGTKFLCLVSNLCIHSDFFVVQEQKDGPKPAAF